MSVRLERHEASAAAVVATYGAAVTQLQCDS